MSRSCLCLFWVMSRCCFGDVSVMSSCLCVGSVMSRRCFGDVSVMSQSCLGRSWTRLVSVFFWCCFVGFWVVFWGSFSDALVVGDVSGMFR